ncbi:MAG: exodeoxyribonuclease VII large subunit [Alphaproteobacteria bacterium]|nr:MAG: exodeoxyribonuclease VII large subunit [Alphaproteobacteria bacterium]
MNIECFNVKSLSVSIRQILEASYSKIYVRGFVSQPKRMNHLYFSLKEDDALIDCVAWASTKLKFEPQHDMEIVCCGRITTYAGRSKYQIIILSIEHIGDSQVLEKRKLALEKEGLFDVSKKPKLPKYPQTIGIITSPTGSVLHDMIHRLRDRYPCRVILYPVLVQGTEMVESVIGAINFFNNYDINSQSDCKVDLLILARGGGSFEDLWGFQDENLVRAVAKSSIPIVTAIGHETDTTLVDYASSCRAPTPTAAIELALPDRKELINKVSYITNQIYNKVHFLVENLFARKLLYLRPKPVAEMFLPMEQKLHHLIAKQNYAYNLYWSKQFTTMKALRQIKLNLQPFSTVMHDKFEYLRANFERYLVKKQDRLDLLLSNMKNISYQSTLSRGFCRAYVDGKVIKQKSDAPKNFSLEFIDGSINVTKKN